MEFGIIKSKIEKKLEDAYSQNKLNSEIKNFKKFVLENEGIRKAYHIYNELSATKSFEKTFAEDFVNECIDLYSRISFDKKTISLIENWVKEVKVQNQYKDIDTVLAKNTLVIENILNSKKRIVSQLTKKDAKSEMVNLPLEKIYEVAQQNLKNYLTSLEESDLNQIKKYLTLTEEEVKKRFDVFSEMVIEKLESIQSSSDEETKKKISETIEKIKTEEVNSVNLLKLKTLNESL